MCRSGMGKGYGLGREGLYRPEAVTHQRILLSLTIGGLHSGARWRTVTPDTPNYDILKDVLDDDVDVAVSYRMQVGHGLRCD